jgi:hypothetical protein
VQLRLVLTVVTALAAVGLSPAAGARALDVRKDEAVAAPIRMAFYYPWFPEGWSHAGFSPYTHFTPSLGFYDAGDPAVIKTHIKAMRWGRIRAGAYSWWGQGSSTDQRFSTHLSVATPMGFRWAVYHELEGYEDPSIESIRSDLEYIERRYAWSLAYLRIDGRFVVFAYGDGDDGSSCDVANRWVEAAGGKRVYLILKAFKGFRLCAHQPDGWHPYQAERARTDLAPYAFTISPGFFFAPEARPRLARSLRQWRSNIRRMVRSRARLQLVISFNEWGEGTAVESAAQWASRSGFGRYLDALREIK